MNRSDFQVLADIRIAEARILFANGQHDGAYYLAGYAIEFALKACIAKLTREFDFPDKEFASKSYTHEIEKLVVLGGLGATRSNATQADPILDANWRAVKDWTESSRYERKTQADAQRLIDAIADPAHGVLQWLKQHW